MRTVEFRDQSMIGDHNAVREVSITNVEMQFTGLYDCNRKKIWEGDILKNVNVICAHVYTRYGIVYWDKDHMGFAINWMDWMDDNAKNIQRIEFEPSTYEVVGNIYQNEEFLNEIKQCEK